MKQMIFKILIIPLTFAFFILAGCSQDIPEIGFEEKAKPVKVITIEKETRSKILSYIGYMSAKEMTKLSFKTGGEIEDVFVKEGELIKAGDPLISLETEDLTYAVNAAKAGKDSAWISFQEALDSANIEKKEIIITNIEDAKNDYNLSVENYKKIKEFFINNMATNDEYNAAKHEYEIKVTELTQAEETLRNAIAMTSNEKLKVLISAYEQAKKNYDNLEKQLESSRIEAEAEGIVVSILSKKGELIGAGYPVIIIRSVESILTVGITQNDIGDIEEGVTVTADISGKQTSGEITRIDETPDEISRTYNIDITLKESGYRIGTIVRVYIPAGIIEGIWIPITSVLTNGEDFVYVIENSRAIRKIIAPIDYIENYVRVKGLSGGETLIVEGIGLLKENDPVVIVEE